MLEELGRNGVLAGGVGAVAGAAVAAALGRWRGGGAEAATGALDVVKPQKMAGIVRDATAVGERSVQVASASCKPLKNVALEMRQKLCASFLTYPFSADLEKVVSINLFRLPEIRFTQRPTVCLFAFKVTWLRNYDPQQVVLIPLHVEGTLQS